MSIHIAWLVRLYVLHVNFTLLDLDKKKKKNLFNKPTAEKAASAKRSPKPVKTFPAENPSLIPRWKDVSSSK